MIFTYDTFEALLESFSVFSYVTFPIRGHFYHLYLFKIEFFSIFLILYPSPPTTVTTNPLPSYTHTQADHVTPSVNSVIFDLYELHQSGLFVDFQMFSNHLDRNHSSAAADQTAAMDDTPDAGQLAAASDTSPVTAWWPRHRGDVTKRPSLPVEEDKVGGDVRLFGVEKVNCCCASCLGAVSTEPQQLFHAAVQRSQLQWKLKKFENF